MNVKKGDSNPYRVKALMVLLGLVLSACAPSTSVIQTAIAETQEAPLSPISTPTQWAWNAIKSIFTQEQQNDSEIWRVLPLASNLTFPDAFQMKLDMESVGANVIVLENSKNSMIIACEEGTLGVFLRNDTTVDPAFDNNDNRPGMPIIDGTTVCQITVIFDQYAKHIDIFKNDLRIFQLTPEEVGDFPGGLFPDGKIREVDLTSGPRSGNPRSGSGHIISSVKLNKLVFYAPAAVMSIPTAADVPVPSPTILPTATSQPSSFSLYDDFSSGSASNNFNTALWNDLHYGGTVNWQDGYLVFSGVSVGNELESRNPSQWRIDQISKLQADLRIDKVSGGYAFSKIQLLTNLYTGQGWWTQCRAGSFNGKNAQIICDAHLGDTVEYQTEEHSIDFNKFYTVAIEIASDGSYVRYYVNDDEIGEYLVTEKILLSNAVFEWRIGLWMGSGVTATGAVDNVMVGASK